MNPGIKALLTVAVAVVLLIASGPSSHSAVPDNASVLVGHWRTTSIVFESPRDEHLVLNADGTAQNWVVTASNRSGVKAGTWKVEGRTLVLLLAGSNEVSLPFTIHEGQLVFPNIQNRRRFWERLKR
jgi:hypothetical protein